MSKDLTENTEFRIKWPRGQLGSLPADSEQFMMIEDLYKTTEKIEKHIDAMSLNKVNIEFLRKQMDKVLEDIEELKDANREIHYKNGKKEQILTEIVFALLMFVNGEIKEHRIQPSMGICLKAEAPSGETVQ
jgi:TolA-binding protein